MQIKEFISIPMAIKALKQDRQQFNNRSMANVYLSKIDHVINQMQDDFNAMRGKYYNKVRRIDSHTYIVDGEERTFTSEELKQMTSDTMQRYMSGDKATPFEVDNKRLYNENPDI